MLSSPPQLQLRDCTIDLLSGQVRRGVEVHRLSATELACITYLSERPGLAVSREELLDKVWGYDAKVFSRTVDATVRRLRKKIEVRPSTPVHLVTVHGAGYRLEGLQDEPRRVDPWPMPRLRGRAAVLETLRNEPGPLLTLTGPPGIGKSQLASALAHHHVGTVLWADVALAQPDLHDLSAMLGLRDDLTAAFSVLPAPLVVLDNAESHVEALTPQVAGWLEEVPGLMVVCTSRTPLGHPRERLVTVVGLEPEDAASLLGGSGVDFQALAAALEYNPLALTVAAEACQLLGPRAVLERIHTQQDAFGLGRRSLDAAVETSWRLLCPSQQRLLTLASLAPGGLPLVILERWAGGETLSDVQGLLRHALVRTRDARGGPRIEVPYPVRRFARQRATATDLTDLQAQVAWWASEQQTRFDGPEGEMARAMLRAMAPCLLFAAQLAGPQHDRCLASWSVAVEDVMLSQAVLRTLTTHPADSEPRCPALAHRLALVHWRLGQFADSIRLANLGVGLEPEPAMELALLNVLANAYFDVGDVEAVAAVDARAVALDVPQPERLAWTVHRATRLLYASDPDAVAALEAAWADAHQAGALRLGAYVASQLAGAYSWRGDVEQAVGLLDAALALCQSAKDWSYRAILLHKAADAAADRGLVVEAEQFLLEAETTWRSLGRPHPLDRLYLIRAKVVFLQDDPSGAIAVLSQGMVKASTKEGRVHAALVLRGMIRTYCGDFSAGLRDLEEPDLRGRPVMSLFRHTTRLLTLLRLGEVDRAREEHARAQPIAMASLAQYRALAHAGFALYLGEEGARGELERHRGTQPSSMEFRVLWAHLDWVLARADLVRP